MTYSKYPTVVAFQVEDRVTLSTPESPRWFQGGTIEDMQVEKSTVTVKWDIDGDNQIATFFRTHWTSELKIVESHPNSEI
jgi:hypothetical protein